MVKYNDFFFYTVEVEVLTTIAIKTAVTYYATPCGSIPTFGGTCQQIPPKRLYFPTNLHDITP